MLESIFNFLLDQVFGNIVGSLPFPIQLILYAVLGALGIFVGRKFIFLNIMMRFFPQFFVKFMIDLGAKSNEFFEKKKAKGKYKKSWQIAEEKLIEAIAGFNAELKKD